MWRHQKLQWSQFNFQLWLNEQNKTLVKFTVDQSIVLGVVYQSGMKFRQFITVHRLDITM